MTAPPVPAFRLRRLRTWVHDRAHHRHPLSTAHISKQRKAALYATVFAAIRTVAWVICMLLIIAHWAGAGGSFLHGFITLSGSVVFVTFISFYCNASTDAANLTAGMAALFSADSHHDAEAARTELAVDFRSIETDIARLAELQPGPEAATLAASIRARLP